MTPFSAGKCPCVTQGGDVWRRAAVHTLRRSIFSCFASDIRLDTIINVHPTCSCSETKWRSLCFAPASEICNAVFLLAARTLGFPRHCRQVRYGLIFLGFIHHSSPFSGTGRNPPRLLIHIENLCMIEQSRSKDPWAAFGGNWAALQRNQVRLW